MSSYPDSKGFSRRQLLARAAALTGVAATPAWLHAQAPEAPGDSKTEPKSKAPLFRYSLNMATIRGQKLNAAQQIDVAGEAGYDVVEPWMGDLRDYLKNGGTVGDLRKKINDHGMTLESAIGFAAWIVDDNTARAKGLEDAKRDMELIAELGGKRIAAPAVGATKDCPKLDLKVVAERYRALLELGDKTGIVPELEIWGFSVNLTRLSECLSIAAEADHPQATVLADVYHLYKGNSPIGGLQFLPADVAPVVHMNDYPAIKPETIVDADRIYPGDGVAPMKEVLTMLAAGGPRILSLELFNKEYWAQPAPDVAKNGLAKMKAAVAAAGF